MAKASQKLNQAWASFREAWPALLEAWPGPLKAWAGPREAWAELASLSPGLAIERPGLAPERHGLAPERSGLAPTEPGLAPKKPGLAPKKPGLAPKRPGLAPKRSGLPSQGLCYRQMKRDGQTDGRTDSPCILQDFVPSGTLWGRCPAYTIDTIQKYQSRARVPMTISCLWATGFNFFWFTLILGHFCPI